MSDGLLELRDWLLENGVTRVGMEATASYWKPLLYTPGWSRIEE